MENIAESLRTVFTKNRAEEHGYDVWNHFVVPPFYDRLDLYKTRKSRLIIGGRGCGKTMLLRYLSHQSTFSPSRPTIPSNALSHIGLYWRIDTSFVRVMNERGLPADTWESAFGHLIALIIGEQVVQSIHSIANSQAPALELDEIRNIRFNRLAVYDPAFDVEFGEIDDVFKTKVSEFEMWVANVRKRPEPEFLPGTNFLSALISEVRRQLQSLNEAIYFVYIDEFENLLEYQQRIINTCIKHSESPLIFNVAMKRNGFATKKTLGEESIADIADYRQHDLEQYLLKDSFELFAAEVLCLNLVLASFKDVPVEPQMLHDPERLEERRKSSYREKVLSHVRGIFPGMSHDQLAQSVLQDESLGKKLLEDIKDALKDRRSKIPASKFLRLELPKASITTTALLRRKNLKTEEIAKELDKLEAGSDNRFTGKTDWIHNNFIGCLLRLYGSYPRACPFYAGFDTFCLLARSNLRHFLELCHKSINQALRRTQADALPVSLAEQAVAARQTSAEFLTDVRSFGKLGNRLHNFLLGLGSLFALAHRQPAQSEPERRHFVIRGAEAVLEKLRPFLDEATKWSVLYEQKETKQKGVYEPVSYEYVLNPIYSPYFNISYRKGRKLVIEYNDFATLVDGNYEEIRALLRRYSKTWAVRLADTDPMLFSHLLEEA